MTAAPFRYVREHAPAPADAPAGIARLVWELARQHLATRYQGSALGILWSVLNPLAMMLLFTFVFAIILRASIPGVPYTAYFLTGYLMWNAIHMAVVSNTQVLIENRALVLAYRFPIWVLPVSRAVAAFLNLCLLTPVLVAVNAMLGVAPGPGLLLVPLLYVGALAFAVGLSLMVAALTPDFRDLTHLVELGLMALYFSAPVLYPITMVESALGPEALALYAANPATALVRLAHGAFLGMPLAIADLVAGFAAILATLALGIGIFRWRQRRLVWAL